MAFFAIGLSLLSCKKDKEEPKQVDPPANEFRSSEDNNRQQKEFDDVLGIVFNVVDDEVAQNNKAREAATSCANATLEGNKITVDFGEDGCLYNGIGRKGKLIVIFTGHYLDSGSVLKITLDNYRVQDSYVSADYVKVEGVETITNKGNVTDGMLWTVNVENANITFADGTVSKWASLRNRILVDEGSSNPFDEVYHIYGNASGVNRDGVSYTASATSEDPVVFDYTCWLKKRMLVGGIITVAPEGKLIRSIDYGYEKVPGESCDRSVTITYGTFSFNLDL